MQIKKTNFVLCTMLAATFSFPTASLGKPTGLRKTESSLEEQKADERKSPAKFDVSLPTKGMDVRAEQKRDEAITKLKKLMPSIPEGPQKAELNFRLAEKYWSKSRFQYLQAMQAWDKALEAWDSAGRKSKEPKLKGMAEYKLSRKFKDEALKLYNKIRKRYPRYPRKDEVYYNLGSALYESGNKTKGIKMFIRLLKERPKSTFAPDAWLQLGEHYFNTTGKLTKAVKAYKNAAKSQKPRIYSYALYKLAWCDYNLGEYADSLKKFREVVEYSLGNTAPAKSGKMQSRDRIQLIEEALSDMIRTYSHLDAVEDAFDYYTDKLGKEKAYSYLRKLGKLYNAEGKSQTEIDLYRELNSRYPNHPKAPFNHTAVMNAFAKLDRKDDVRREVRRMIDLYAPEASWAAANNAQPQLLEEAFEMVEQELSGLVSEQHKEAQQTKLVETYKLARDLYKEYLDKFTTGVNAYKFRYLYAEILADLKQVREAADQYDLVADVEGKFKKQAAIKSIFNWEKVIAGVKETKSKKIDSNKKAQERTRIKGLEKRKKLKKGISYEPIELTKDEIMLSSACDRFVKIAPEDTDVVKIKFESAQLYYLKNHFDEASKRFGEIIDRWPKDKLAKTSAKSIVESYNVREDWTQLNLWSRKFQGNPLLMADKRFAKAINEYVEGASFQEIRLVLEPKAESEQAGDLYVQFSNEFPESRFTMIAIFNAMMNYDKSNKLEKALAQGTRILDDFKNFKIKKADVEKSKKDGSRITLPAEIREKAMFLQAEYYGRLAEFSKSAKLYETYFFEFKKGDKRSDAIYNASVYREGLGEYVKSTANWKLYMKLNPKADDIPKLTWRLGEILVKKRDFKAAQDYFYKLSKSLAKAKNYERSLCATYKVMENLIKQGKKKDAEGYFKTIAETYEKLDADEKKAPCALDAVAYVSFEQLEPRFTTYKAISLNTTNQRTLGKNLETKLAQVPELEAEYTKVLAIGQGDFGIASLYRIGVVYQNMSDELLGSPCPPNLTDDQCGMYQAALQEKAFPLENKAIEAYDKTLAKAYELGLYNDWLVKAQDALAVYEPGRFPDMHEYPLIPSELTQEAPKVAEALK
ncbi:MAG: tetratricopeptide repeat protein [Myxococcota bacterium]|nr:tetratricopeptide repeat protein [Myxococcota bacterium]